MDQQTTFYGKSVAIDLARVMAFERPTASGIAEILGRRRNLRVTLKDGSNLFIEGDDDTDGFIIAIGKYYEEAQSLGV